MISNVVANHIITKIFQNNLLYFQDLGEVKSNNPLTKPDGSEDMQPHLLPQLVDTSLVVGPITQVCFLNYQNSILYTYYVR